MRSIFLTAIVLLCATANAELATLTIAPGSFPDPSSVSVFVDAGLLGDDEVISSISGEVVVNLLPSAMNPTTVQIVELDAQVDDAIDFRVGGGLLLPTVTVNAGAGDVRVDLVTPGPGGAVTSNQFDQLENFVAIEGIVRTSIQAEPFDLSEQDSTVVDFEDVFFEQNEREIQIEAALLTDVSIPVEVGFLTVNIGVSIDGVVLAQGTVPPATYVWDSLADRESFSTAENWLRGDVAGTNSIPSAIDTATFTSQAETPLTVDLQGTRSLASLEVVDNFQFVAGTLQVGENIAIGQQGTLGLANDASLSSATNDTAIEIGGGGNIVVAGQIDSPIHLQNVVLSSAGGTVDDVQLGPGSTLELSTNSPLTGNSLSFLAGSELRIVSDSLESGVLSLATEFAGGIDSTGLFQGADGAQIEPTIVYNQQALAFDQDEDLFRGHVGEGVFSSLTLAADSISLTNQQAAPGDIDGDGTIGFPDFLVLSASFGQAGGWTDGDFDGNGRVEFPDFLVLSEGFGNVAATAAVPEPAWTRLASIIAILAALRWVRRIQVA